MTEQAKGMPMGPPMRGPFARIVGCGVSLHIRLDTQDDIEILSLAVQMAERRRYGRAAAAIGSAT